MRVVLASSAKKPELEHHVALLNVADVIDGATSADDADRSKPCPDILRAALDHVQGVDPGSALVVGDSPYDAVAAARAGMPTIGLLSGGFTSDELRQAGVIAIYRDIGELHGCYEASPLGRLRETA
jgi:phosphoglycolate phosphatase-like HAD superfamily hydrolase